MASFVQGLRRWQGSGKTSLQLLMVLSAIVGAVLRIRMFLEERSLWLDPAMLALNVVDRDFGELLGRLDMNQAAPAGFLWLSKALGSVFDYSEYSLYLTPCLFGVVAFLLFIRLSIDVLGPGCAPLAYLPMATCSTAIFYCGEFRPQSFDLFFTVLVLLAGRQVLNRDWAPVGIASFAAVSIVALWFSYAVLFVVAGSGAALVLLAITSAQARARLQMTVAFGAVMGFFLVLYLLHIRPSIGSGLYTANTAAYAPLVAVAKAQWWWILAVTGYFEFPLGFRGLFIVPMGGFVAGVAVCLSDKRYRPVAAIFGAPIILVLAASGLGMYPIATGLHEVKARFMLFTVPIALIFMAVGISRVFQMVGKIKILAYLIVASLLIPSFGGALSGPRFPGQEMRPLVQYLEQHIQAGDSVYVFHASVPAFRFYTRHDPIEAVFGGSLQRSNVQRDLQRIRNAGRLWVVVSHAHQE